ncbi:hypothetical protein HUU40_26545 [candidate division KSB1 bacterium]|nr:hypothetical protein [candidate division KSB1 bacterium]
MSKKDYLDLVELSEYSFPVRASDGVEPRAHLLAARCQKAYAFLSATLESKPKAQLLILAPKDWQKYTGSPMFGVPQTIDEQTVVVAGQNAELWKKIVPPLDMLPPSHAQVIQATYGQADGSIDVAGYMDLLPVHEVAHLFVDQAAQLFDFHLPRRWLVELFCNLALHAYTATEEPEQFSNLAAFPQMIVALGNDHLTYRSLHDFEQLYAGMEPPNFVWYLSRLHIAAQRIYDTVGTEALRRLFNAIVQSKASLSDEQLVSYLQANVHPAVADVLVTWER